MVIMVLFLCLSVISPRSMNTVPLRGAESKNKSTKCCYVSSSYLVFGHRTDNKRAHHPRQSTHAVGNAHQDAGVAWRDVQMIDIKA